MNASAPKFLFLYAENASTRASVSMKIDRVGARFRLPIYCRTTNELLVDKSGYQSWIVNAHCGSCRYWRRRRFLLSSFQLKIERFPIGEWAFIDFVFFPFFLTFNLERFSFYYFVWLFVIY